MHEFATAGKKNQDAGSMSFVFFFIVARRGGGGSGGVVEWSLAVYVCVHGIKM